MFNPEEENEAVEPQEETPEQEEVQETEPEEEGEPQEETGEEEEATPATEETKTVPLKAVLEERRKRQALEEENRRLKEEQQQRQEKPDNEKTIYDFYEENPQGVVNWINDRIKQLVDEDPFGNALQIEQLRDQKLELHEYGKRRVVEKQTGFQTKLNQAIPNFSQKREAVAKYAVEELGYTPQELNTFLNPAVVGESTAIKNTRLIMRQYEQANAGANLEKKETKKQPTRVEGSTVPSQKAGPSMDKLMKDAKRTGDWSQVLKARGIVQD